MRVEPERAPDVRGSMAEGEHVIRVIELDGRDEEALHPPLARGVQGPFALVGGEALQVAVRVDQAHLTRVPLGTWTPGWRSTGLPSIEAASTMPCDSIPMSLAGWRFATTTTCLFTRSSG